MITEYDLQEAIAECQGERNPNANTAIRLAAFLTIQREMFGKSEQLTAPVQLPTYSYAPEPPEKLREYSGADSVGDYGGSEFLQAVKGKDAAAMWEVMDDLMDTLLMVNKRVYDGVLRKIKD